MKAFAKRAPLLVVALGLVASLLLISIGRIGAQGNDASGSGLSVSPTRTELKIERGGTDKVEVAVRNVTRGAIIAKPSISDFESDDATGEPKLVEKRNSASIANFVKGLSDIQLAPGESKNVTYTVSVPGDAPAGAYYGAIVFRAVPTNQSTPESGEVALTANVASLVLVEVPGDITEQIQVNSVKVLKADKAGTFFTGVPNKVAISIKNNGNSFSKPFGTVTITNTSGKQIYSYELNNATPRSNILPKSTRVFTDDIKNVKKPGRYTVTANISHGTGGEVLTSKVSFWYIPVWLLIVLLVLVAGVAGGGYYLYRKQSGGKKKK